MVHKHLFKKSHNKKHIHTMDTKKKIQYTVGGILIFIIGGIVGMSAVGWYFEKNKGTICQARTEVKAAVPDERTLAALVPGRIVFGRVTAKAADRFTVVSALVNPINPQEKKNVEIHIPVVAQDMFFRMQKNAEGVLQSVAVSYGEVKVGDQVTVKVLEGGKKEIYLPIQK